MDIILMFTYTVRIRELQVTYVTFIHDPLMHSFYMFSHVGPLFEYLVTLLTFISKLFMYYLDMTGKAVSTGKPFFANLVPSWY